MTTDTTSTALEKMNERLQDFIKHYDGHKESIPPPEVQMDPIRVDYAEPERLERDAGKTGRSQDEIYRPGDLEKGYWGISERKIRDFFSSIDPGLEQAEPDSADHRAIYGPDGRMTAKLYELTTRHELSVCNANKVAKKRFQKLSDPDALEAACQSSQECYSDESTGTAEVAKAGHAFEHFIPTNPALDNTGLWEAAAAGQGLAQVIEYVKSHDSSYDGSNTLLSFRGTHARHKQTQKIMKKTFEEATGTKMSCIISPFNNEMMMPTDDSIECGSDMSLWKIRPSCHPGSLSEEDQKVLIDRSLPTSRVELLDEHINERIRAQQALTATVAKIYAESAMLKRLKGLASDSDTEGTKNPAITIHNVASSIMMRQAAQYRYGHHAKVTPANGETWIEDDEMTFLQDGTIIRHNKGKSIFDRPSAVAHAGTIPATGSPFDSDIAYGSIDLGDNGLAESSTLAATITSEDRDPYWREVARRLPEKYQELSTQWSNCTEDQKRALGAEYGLDHADSKAVQAQTRLQAREEVIIDMQREQATEEARQTAQLSWPSTVCGTEVGNHSSSTKSGPSVVMA